MYNKLYFTLCLLKKIEMFVDIRCPIRVECILSCSTTSAFCTANIVSYAACSRVRGWGENLGPANRLRRRLNLVPRAFPMFAVQKAEVVEQLKIHSTLIGQRISTNISIFFNKHNVKYNLLYILTYYSYIYMQ